MALILEDTGAAKILKAYFQNVWPGTTKDLTLKLYATNVTPSSTGADTAGSFTEASGGGYAAITLTNGTGFVESNVGGIEQVAYAQQTFTFTGALTTNGTIYGYYVVDHDNDVIWAEKAGSTFTPANNGDTYKVTPIFQLSHGTPGA
jgi:hypothetical protein